MSLLQKLIPPEKAIKLPLSLAERIIDLTYDEKKLKGYLKKAHSHVAWKMDAELNNQDYRITKAYIEKYLRCYADGRFRQYFEHSLQEIYEWERVILGYGLFPGH